MDLQNDKMKLPEMKEIQIKETGGEVMVYFFCFSLDNSERETGTRERRRRGRVGWAKGIEERARKDEDLRRKKSGKNVNSETKNEKDTKQFTFLSATLLSLSLCGHSSGILGLWVVTKQPEPCRNCVGEPEREEHAG